jgi:hypothetical protein
MGHHQQQRQIAQQPAPQLQRQWEIQELHTLCRCLVDQNLPPPSAAPASDEAAAPSLVACVQGSCLEAGYLQVVELQVAKRLVVQRRHKAQVRKKEEAQSSQAGEQVGVEDKPVPATHK